MIKDLDDSSKSSSLAISNKPGNLSDPSKSSSLDNSSRLTTDLANSSKSGNLANSRVAWLDVAKFFGIFSIYMGHYADLSAKSYYFVAAFVVEMFFFLSGCASNFGKGKENTNPIKHMIKHIIKQIVKKARAIMLPFFSFALISILVSVLEGNGDIYYTLNLFTIVGKGCIRNQFIAGSLWFLSCLFIMEILFDIIKLVKIRVLMLLICLFCYGFSHLCISPDPIQEPHWLYNLDSCLHFIIFYATGYLLFPYIRNLSALDSRKKRLLFFVLFIISLAYAFLTFFSFDISSYDLSNASDISAFSNASYNTSQEASYSPYNMRPVIMSLFSFLEPSRTRDYLSIFHNIIRPHILMWSTLSLSILLQKIKLFNDIGRETLYLCGNEYVLKTLFGVVFMMLDIKFTLPNPLTTHIYAFILILFAVKAFIPFEKKIAKALMGSCNALWGVPNV